MKTQFTIQGIVTLRNGTTALTGSIEGPLLNVGQHGFAALPTGAIEMEVVGIGGDRDLVKPDMQMILVKILVGEDKLLEGATLIFN